jgi:hypothetical protein
MTKIAATHRVNQKHNSLKPRDLNFSFLLLSLLILSTLTFSYLFLSYPQYPYRIDSVAESIKCHENCERCFWAFFEEIIVDSKKAARRSDMRPFQTPTMGVVGYPPNLHRPGTGGVTALCPGSIVCFA